MSSTASPGSPALRDPAWAGRLFWTLAALLLLLPLLQATEFRLAPLFEPQALKVSGQFLASFWPLRWDGPFLWQLAQDGWRTVAMATAGLTLGFVIAVPLAVLMAHGISPMTEIGGAGTGDAG